MVKKCQRNNYGLYYTHPSTGGDAPSSVSVIWCHLFRSSEAAPLLPGTTQRTRVSTSPTGRVVGWCLLALVFLFMAYPTYMHSVYCPPDLVTRIAIRREWEVERLQHDVLRREWKLERERWRREVEERDQREEEERQRRHMFWGNVRAHTCTTYATREYTAQLMNLPTDWKHRVDACKSIPLEVHGISYVPKACEDKGPGVVIGRWEINQGQPDCTTFWESYNDKGCTSPGSGKKYITHKLMNLPEKGDWREFCATTPAHFNHMQFPGAQECFTVVWGVYGQWEIDDSNC